MKGFCLGLLVLGLCLHAGVGEVVDVEYAGESAERKEVIVDGSGEKEAAWKVGRDGVENAPTPDVFSDACWPERSSLPYYPLDECHGVWPESDMVKIGTYNAEWLFTGVNPPKGCPWTTPADAQQHMSDIAAVIKRNDPSIINVVEVEDITVLQSVALLLTPEKNYQSYLVPGTDTSTRQNVGLLTEFNAYVRSRSNCKASYPRSGSKCGSTLTGKSTGISKHMISLFDSCLFGKKFAIVGAHLKAFPNNPDPCAQREGQARVLQDILNQLMDAKFEIILMGDLNDFDDMTLDASSNVPYSRVLQMLKDPNGDGEQELHNIIDLIPDQYERYTAWAKGPQLKTMIDHILVTDELYRRVNTYSIDHSYQAGNPSDHWPYFIKLITSRHPYASRKLQWWGDLGGARRAAAETWT